MKKPRPPTAAALIRRSYVTQTLRGAIDQMSEQQRLTALDCYDFYTGELRRAANESLHTIAASTHVAVDRTMDEMLRTSKHAAEVKCSKGCAACCHLMVEAMPAEASLALAHAQDQGVTIDRERLERQATKTIDSWHELSPADRACVFLGPDQACQIYEHRPTACRKYLVKTPPEQCDAVRFPGAAVGIVFSVEAEILTSAAMTLYGSESMTAGVLRELQNQESGE